MSRKKRKQSQNSLADKSSPSNTGPKKPFVILAVLFIAVIGIGILAFRTPKTTFVNASDRAAGSQLVAGNGADGGNIENLKGGETKPVLSPTRFKGKTAASYQLARDNRELLDSMYCYCYCKRTIGHKSLLSCFTDGHASKCTICQDQAFYAQIMQGKGLDIGEVRKEVDRKFWRPFS